MGVIGGINVMRYCLYKVKFFCEDKDSYDSLCVILNLLAIHSPNNLFVLKVYI